ncbi:hypothetical protein EP331_14715 [bacterium]|nr:MAG: hypothetical protein EP331_14715 [bacterium]
MKRIVWLCFFVFISATSVFAQKNRNAFIQVKNSSNSTIYNVIVIHKYSDISKEKKTWIGELKPGQSTPADFKVRYQTGFGRTGADWWIVTWTEARDENSVTQYTTDPQNFRGIIDQLEKGAKKGIPIATTVIGVASVGLGPVAGLAVAGGSIVANEIADKTLGNGGTAGFKKHTLKEEDKKLTTVINITKKRNVSFKSKSGKSTTETKSKVINFEKQ